MDQHVRDRVATAAERGDWEECIRSFGYRTLPDTAFLSQFHPLICAAERGDVAWLVQEVMLIRTQRGKTPDEVFRAKKFQDARAEALEGGCLCSTSGRIPEICAVRSPDGMFGCCRGPDHSGFHVACAGPMGPHGICAWPPRG